MKIDLSKIQNEIKQIDKITDYDSEKFPTALVYSENGKVYIFGGDVYCAILMNVTEFVDGTRQDFKPFFVSPKDLLNGGVLDLWNKSIETPDNVVKILSDDVHYNFIFTINAMIKEYDMMGKFNKHKWGNGVTHDIADDFVEIMNNTSKELGIDKFINNDIYVGNEFDSNSMGMYISNVEHLVYFVMPLRK